MKIYFEMLCYVLSKLISREQIGSPNQAITSVRYTDSAGYLSLETAVILDADTADLDAFFSAMPSHGRTFPLNVFILSEAEERADAAFAVFSLDDNLACIICPGREKGEIIECIEKILFRLTKWEAAFNDKLLNNSNMVDFLDLGKVYIPFQFFIFDRDLNSFYNSDESAYPSADFQTWLSQGLFDDLVSDRKFHDAVNEKGIFYYENQDGDVSICHNITLDGEYIARIVMRLTDGSRRMHPGGEMIFKIYSDYVNKAFNLGKYTLGSHSGDKPHRILKDLAAGKTYPKQILDMNFSFLSRENNGPLIVAVFIFYREELWPAHLETTLPYMAARLEKAIGGSIAVAFDKEIVMLKRSPAEGAKDPVFLKQTATFVRENLCKAGISASFDDFSDTGGAIRCARAALEVGHGAKPDLWYYLFDDFRLDYIVRACTRDIAPGIICHPVIKALKKYDSENNTQLNQTLYVYLKNNLNMTRAADEIYIHRTSFFHRINRIKELTSVDLDDPGTVLELRLSYEMLG